MNVFDELIEALKYIRGGMERIEAAMAAPKPEWETLTTAIETRGKGRRTLLKAVAAGKILCKREVGRGGQQNYLLRRADLDAHFPTRK